MQPRRYRPGFMVVVLIVVIGGTLAAAQRPIDTKVLNTLDDPVLGTIFVDGAGRKLYVHIDESGATLACDDSTCMRFWRPVLDGTEQLSYQSLPLFLPVGDSNGGSQAGGLGRAWFAVNAGPIVRVSSHPVYGEILVGPNGRTLYTYADDEQGKYQCDESCSENFPPLVVSHRAFLGQRDALDGALAGIDRNADSLRSRRVQVTYLGQPLYYWSRDSRPGDVTADGIAGLWHVARPSGTPSR